MRIKGLLYWLLGIVRTCRIINFFESFIAFNGNERMPIQPVCVTPDYTENFEYGERILANTNSDKSNLFGYCQIKRGACKMEFCHMYIYEH